MMNRTESHPVEALVLAAVVTIEALAVLVAAVLALVLTVWSQAQAQLQEAVKTGSKGGRPPKGETATQRVAVSDPTLNGVGRQPKDRKSRLIRTLPNPPLQHPLAVLAETLQALPQRELMALAGTRRKLPKHQLAALLVAACG